MKKVTLLIIAVLAVFNALLAQNYRIISSSANEIKVEFKADAFYSEKIVVNGEPFSALRMNGFDVSFEKGAPQVPVLNRFLSVPVCNQIEVSIEKAEYLDFDASEFGVDFTVFPAQGSVSKSDKNPKFQKNQDIYNTDDFFALPIVSAQKSGIFRNISLADVTFAPVAYNPVSNKIRIYTKVVAKFEFKDIDQSSTKKLSNYNSPLFSIDNSLIINNISAEKGEISSAPISYLIVAHSMFRNNEDLNDFVEWKKKMGYVVKIAYTDEPEVGTTRTSIQSFIQSCFDNATSAQPAPDYLLLVGDNQQIPAFTSSIENHVTDLYYATTIGTDNLPDCYYGRLSAQNNSQLSAQIQKILMYEQYTMPDPSYLGNAILIAGADDYYSNTHANGQMNYVNQNYINTQKPNYNDVKLHLHNCTSQAAQIRSEISDGAGWVNYSAHGDWDCWYQPSFNVTHIANLQNTNKYGIFIGNCCESGKFDQGECFGEALLRAENKGAMAYIGASNSSYWDEDYYWAVGIRSNINANPSYQANNLGMYDRLFHSHNENYDKHIATVGAMIFAGNMAVENSSSSRKKYYWEIYHCFGDPSTMAFLGIPTSLNVDYQAAIPIGDQYLVLTTEPYAYVALTHDNEFVIATFANAAGVAELPISNISEPGEYELAVTAQNKIPFFGNLQIITPNSAYITATKSQAQQNIDFQTATNVNIDLQLKNVGTIQASNVYAVLSTENPQIAILNDSVFVGNMDAEQIFTQDGAFIFTLPAQIVDNEYLNFDLKIHWDTTEIYRTVKVHVVLPNMKLYDYYTKRNDIVVVDYNQNDEIDFVFTSKNFGHADIAQGLMDLTCNYSGVAVLSSSSSFYNISSNDNVEKTFRIKISGDVPNKSVVPLYYHTIYGSTHIIDTLSITVGAATETFESGDFSNFEWTMQNKPWIISSATKYAGNYSARSAKNTGSNGISKMQITTSTSEPSTLSYFRKVSSESNYDFFYLYMDENVVDQASGDIDWENVCIDVPAGEHTFCFSYEKDGWYSIDSDCVWIDNVILPDVGIAVIEDIIDEVGVENYNLAQTKIFPNPATQIINITSSNPIKSVELFDIMGKKVKNQDVNGLNNSIININNLQSGVYLLKVIYENNQSQSYKIIKK